MDKHNYEYALYLDRNDLIKALLNESLDRLTDENNLLDKGFKKQKVYPSTQLVHFLIEKN